MKKSLLLLLVLSQESFAWENYTRHGKDGHEYHTYGIGTIDGGEYYFGTYCHNGESGVTFTTGLLNVVYPATLTITVDDNRPIKLRGESSRSKFMGRNSTSYQRLRLIKQMDRGEDMSVSILQDNGVSYEYDLSLEGYAKAKADTFSKCVN